MTKWLALAVIAGCAGSAPPDPALEGLALASVQPGIIVPGTNLVIAGDSFVEAQWGATMLHLQGVANGQQVDVSWPATFVDFSTLNLEVDAGKLQDVGGDVDFVGTATVEVVSTTDDKTYSSAPVATQLSFRTSLTPMAMPLLGGVIFVNDQIEVDGSGFLLGGDEGITVARVAGCFLPDAGDGTCAPIQTQDIPLLPLADLSRTKGEFPFAPRLVGIESGNFAGTVTIVNQPMGASEIPAAPLTVQYTLVTSQIFSVDPPAASLGQYVFVHGGGFVGGEPNALTEVELTGTFTKTGKTGVQVTMDLIPQFVQGTLVEYVINTDDALGQALDLYTDTGHFSGTATPIVTYGSDTVRGVAATIAFDIAPVKQVVYLHYQTAYTEELRDFGLRAVDQLIRDRITAVCNQAYQGVNVEFRTDPVTDFALFEDVELVGVDPNNMGLFGYDNTPGKDTGNMRLYDELGGTNATTQEDGYPGYGGVFLRSLFGFSLHPGAFAQASDLADATFDQTFDPFRADQGGAAIVANDLAGHIPVLTDDSSCPGKDRTSQIACAVYVMGNLVGGTLSHEIGHSLGLAYPYGDGFHDNGDQPNRLMDNGDQRPFKERAQLQGQGPGVFCDDEFTYLQQILPTTAAAPQIQRPGCN